MGGGSSKEQTVKNKAAQQGSPEHDAFAAYSGPAKQAQNQSSTIESPVKKTTKMPVPGQTDDYEPDDQRPAAIAKQVRMSQASMGSMGSPPQKSAKILEAEKQARFAIELQKSQEQAKQREIEENKVRQEMEVKKAKQEAEQEKIRQLQMLKEQQKAQEAAKKAAQATSQQQQYIQQSQGSEVFAQHYSPSPATGSMKKSVGQSDIMSSQGTMGNLNSPQKGVNLNGQKQNQYGLDALAVNGRGLQRDDSFQQFEQHHMQQQSYAPAPQLQFKVINYNEEANQNKKRDYDDNYGNKLGPYKHADSGIHIGMNQADYNKDAEQNRNIDMGELNELLGI